MSKRSQNDYALIIIDIINDFQFTYGEVLSSKTLEMLPNIMNLKALCKKYHVPIIYVNDHYQVWQADLNKIKSRCENPLSKEIIEKLSPEDKEFFLMKPKHSAFYCTPLETFLVENEIKHLILTGIAGNICVLFTANDAYMRGYKLTIPSDCIASVDDQDNQYALRMMENVLKANVTKSSHLSNLFS
ncbi:cysteine hydrolase [Bacillus timonensis]|nr:cysteine hydrolase [Bacillus timonensis]